MSHIACLSRLACLVVVLASSVVGRAETADSSPAEDLLRATFRVYKGATSGTAFVVAVDGPSASSPRRHALVTAAHLFDNIRDADARLVLRVRNEDGSWRRNEVVLPLRDGDKPLWVRHPEVDAAAIWAPSSLLNDGDVHPFELRQVADASWTADRKVRVGQEVLVPCFPAQLEANAAGWPVLRKGSIATHPLFPASTVKTILVDYSHFGGDSGAPVTAVVDGSPVVVGLVVAMQRQTDRSKTAFEERTIHTPLGLAIVVQSPFLLETISRLTPPSG